MAFTPVRVDDSDPGQDMVMFDCTALAADAGPFNLTHAFPLAEYAFIIPMDIVGFTVGAGGKTIADGVYITSLDPAGDIVITRTANTADIAFRLILSRTPVN